VRRRLEEERDVEKVEIRSVKEAKGWKGDGGRFNFSFNNFF